MLFVYVTVFVSSFFFGSTDKAGNNNLAKQALGSGCTFITKTSLNEAENERWYELNYPLLNCSSYNTTLNLNFKGTQNARSLSVSYLYLRSLDINELRFFPNLTKIDLNKNKVTSMTSSNKSLFFNSTTYIRITQSYLNSVPNKALRSFPNLKYLILYSNYLNGLYQDDFRFNTKLKLLYIKGMWSYTFEDNWMNYLNLTSLRIWKLMLKKVPQRMCSMSALKYADLSFNSISYLNANTFSNCSNLQKLTIASNSLKTIDVLAFYGAINLFKVDLTNNEIKTLPVGVFDSLNKEQLEIHLEDNDHMDCMCSMAWFKLWSEEILSNGISSEIASSCTDGSYFWHSYRFKSCNNRTNSWYSLFYPTEINRRKHLCPDNCKCSYSLWDPHKDDDDDDDNDLFDDDFYHEYFHYLGYISLYPSVQCVKANLTSLPVANITYNTKVIRMYGNKLTNFSMSSLHKFSNSLVELELPANEIEFIIPDYTLTIPSLLIINLRMNKIKTISNEMLMPFPHLEQFDIYRNEIGVIPNDLFVFNRKLKIAKIGPNPVQSFQEDFNFNRFIEDLYLQNMSIEFVPSSIKNLKNLTHLRLGNNHITTIKNNSFSHSFELTYLELSNNRITTIESNAFNNLTSLRIIDLAFNRLSRLPGSLFNGLSPFSVILFENPFKCDCNMRDFYEQFEKMSQEVDRGGYGFRCLNPLRMSNKLSINLVSADFYCSDDDRYVKSIYSQNEFDSLSTENTCSSSKTSIVIVVTFFVTLVGIGLLFFVIKFIIAKRGLPRRTGRGNKLQEEPILKEIEMN